MATWEKSGTVQMSMTAATIPSSVMNMSRHALRSRHRASVIVGGMSALRRGRGSVMPDVGLDVDGGVSTSHPISRHSDSNGGYGVSRHALHHTVFTRQSSGVVARSTIPGRIRAGKYA